MCVWQGALKYSNEKRTSEMTYVLENISNEAVTRNYSHVEPEVVELPTFLRLSSSAPEAVIDIRDLRLRTFIGFNPEERTKRQDVVINIRIAYFPQRGIYNDRVESAMDYKRITKKVISHVEKGRFLLLEKLVADVLAICSEQPAITHSRVTIDKPHALRFAESVSLTMEHHAKPSNRNGESQS